ncbi:MAG: hypothetical protein VB144_12215 [Clostridia bacterium]|nr:hypothetical protein [Clostridia bacterium]
MNRITKYVGLDVSKDKIAVAIADSNMGRSHYYGEIRNTVEDVRKLVSPTSALGHAFSPDL